MKYRTPKGIQDILPPETYIWQRVENTARDVFRTYGFSEIRPPILEFTEVFTRSIGEQTDIVEKEMYTFQDRAGRSITLRPEGTASVVRAYVQHHLYNLPQPQKFYYMGPMFRYERPQKGRYRQFHQIGVECFGESDPRVDVEIMQMLQRFLAEVGLQGLRFEINSIGCRQCRPGYRRLLIEFLKGRTEELCGDCLRRYEKNPLRVLDCKIQGCKEATEDAPRIIDSLCQDCRDHFNNLCEMLDRVGMAYRVNHRMVRGLDYYTRTTFEILSDSLGAQNAVAAGGRYDDLVEEFGGPSTPAVGFAVGMERIITLLTETTTVDLPEMFGFFATVGTRAEQEAFVLVSELRKKGFWVEMDYSGASLKSQFRKANKLRAKYVFIIGDDEIDKGVIRYKRMSDGSQGEVPREEFMNFVISL